MILDVKILDPRATIPTRGSSGSIGLDLCAIEEVVVGHADVTQVRTGISVRIPDGFYGRIAPRSGLAAKWGIDVLAGVIDADYEGELIVLLTKHTTYPYMIKPGDRVAQLILEHAEAPTMLHVISDGGDGAVFKATAREGAPRGASGFGSTGK